MGVSERQQAHILILTVGYRSVAIRDDQFSIAFRRQLVRRCMTRKGMSGMIAYIDDFIFIGKTQSECQHMLLAVIKLLREL